MRGAGGWEGLPLHLEVRGDGPPVLLLHGYGASSFSFRHWVPDLERNHRVLLVDLKGCGSAPKPDDDRYAPRDLADPVRRMILRSNLRDLTLVGHSLGGGIALLVSLGLLDSGELGRLRGLVSVAGAAYPQHPVPPFVRLARWPRLARAALGVIPTERLVGSVLRSIVHDPATVDPEQVAGYARPLRSAAARRALVTTARQVVPPDLEALTARYGEIHLPTLLIWGRQDPVVPLDLGRRLARDLPRARLSLLEACGHLPAEERPGESLALLLAFLREPDRVGANRVGADRRADRRADRIGAEGAPT